MLLHIKFILWKIKITSNFIICYFIISTKYLLIFKLSNFKVIQVNPLLDGSQSSLWYVVLRTNKNIVTKNCSYIYIPRNSYEVLINNSNINLFIIIGLVYSAKTVLSVGIERYSSKTSWMVFSRVLLIWELWSLSHS